MLLAMFSTLAHSLCSSMSQPSIARQTMVLEPCVRMSHQRLVSLSQLTTFHKDSIFQGFDHWIDSKTEFAENKLG